MSLDDPIVGIPTRLDIPTLREAIIAIDDLANSLRKIDFLRNYCGKMNQQYRQASMRQNWSNAKRSAHKLATILRDGELLSFPILVYEIDREGSKVARLNATIVGDVLTEIWKNVEWISRGESLSSNVNVMYGMAPISERLRCGSRKLRAAIRAAELLPT